jgi:hypothetical protein
MVPSMSRKSKPKPDDPAQSKRFIDLAHELEAEGDDKGSFERAFRKVAGAERTSREPKARRRK